MGVSVGMSERLRFHGGDYTMPGETVNQVRYTFVEPAAFVLLLLDYYW
jgi:hypothetical protein